MKNPLYGANFTVLGVKYPRAADRNRPFRARVPSSERAEIQTSLMHELLTDSYCENSATYTGFIYRGASLEAWNFLSKKNAESQWQGQLTIGIFYFILFRARDPKR